MVLLYKSPGKFGVTGLEDGVLSTLGAPKNRLDRANIYQLPVSHHYNFLVHILLWIWTMFITHSLQEHWVTKRRKEER